jgi:thioredoxin reductase
MVDSQFDVVIVGGGPAGLSAALMLGRCRRRVAVCDDGRPRNATSRRSHGVFTRDGESPLELLRLGREQLRQYNVAFFDQRCIDARREPQRFIVTLASQQQVSARRLLLATGIVDEVPNIPGVEALYGTSVFHCPYCDGWEVRDRPIAIYGRRAEAADFAIAMKIWSSDLVLCTDGAHSLGNEEARRLARYDIAVRTERILSLEGEQGMLHHIVFENGERFPRRAMFFDTATRQRSDLAVGLGCELNPGGLVQMDMLERTTVPGLYVAGDASCDLNFIAVAAAQGVKAAFALHRELRKEDMP